MHELPLVFFTVFAQAAAGIMLLVALSVIFRCRQIDDAFAPSLLAFIFLIIGGIASTFHLGQPFRAPNVLLGLGRSPMSREIVLFGVFFVLTLIYLILAKTCHQKGKGMTLLFVILSAIFGVILTWAISAVYHIPTVITWVNHYTTLQMFCTMLVIGGLCLAAFGGKRIGLWVSTIVSLVHFAVLPSYVVYMMDKAPELTSQQTIWFGTQSVLMLLALFCGVIPLIRPRHSTTFVTLSIIVILLAELASRIIFYNLWSIPMA